MKIKNADHIKRDYDQFCALRDVRNIEAERITAEYLMRKIEAEPLPSFLNSPRLEDGPDRTSPLEAVAGFAVLGLVFVLIFWGL